jgi:hypothetical protein
MRVIDRKRLYAVCVDYETGANLSITDILVGTSNLDRMLLAVNVKFGGALRL